MSQKEKSNTLETVKLSEAAEALKKATGTILYTFLNDYMFRVILQKLRMYYDLLYVPV